MVLNVNEDYFKTAKSFDKGNWPSVADRSWLEAAGARHETARSREAKLVSL